MASFYTNENFPLGAVHELRRLGHDVLTSLEAGTANLAVPDNEVLHFAGTEGRILLTHNRLHFIRLHRDLKGQHAGIVVCTFDPDFVRLALAIHNAIDGVHLQGALVRVNRPAV